MLTAEKLPEIIAELLVLEEIGCTYDFKERYGVGLNSLEVLGLTKLIKTRIPKCGDHCTKYRDCQYIPLFEKRKSKTKYRLTKEGKILADYLSSDAVTSANIKSLLQKEFSNYSFVDLILSLLMDNPELAIEKLVSSILETTNSTLYSIRTSIRDILDLLVSLELLVIHEGKITIYT